MEFWKLNTSLLEFIAHYDPAANCPAGKRYMCNELIKLVNPLFLIAILCIPTWAQNGSSHTLPYDVGASVQPLRSLHDDDLQGLLDRCIQSNSKWNKMVSSKKMSVGIVDLSDPESVRFARVNGNEMMYAASLPKIAILLAVVDALEKKEVEETEAIQRDLKLMISKSDNQASTRMIDLVGYEKIESVLTDPRYELYDEEYGGGLWVGKRYAAQGRRYPDPIKGLSHAATVSQVCRFYYLLAFGKLVSPDRSKQMLDILVDPALHHKFVNTLDRTAPRAKLFRKSGSWRFYHSDSILVWGPERQYILACLVQDEDGERTLRQLAFAVDEMMTQ